MTRVTQFNSFSCVAACLESIKKDWGDSSFSHESFIKENLDLFNGGEEIEGACDFYKIEEVAQRAGLKAQMCVDSLSFDPKEKAAIVLAYWGNSENNKHCVRLGSVSGNKAIVMNPLHPSSLVEIPIDWVKGAFIIQKI